LGDTELVEPAGRRGRGRAIGADHAIALRQQAAGEIGSVLT
jgi:hypothetical protein